MVSIAIWDHTMLLATRHERTHPASTLAGEYSIYLTRRDGRLSLPRWLVIVRWFTHPQTVTHTTVVECKCIAVITIENRTMTSYNLSMAPNQTDNLSCGSFLSPTDIRVWSTDFLRVWTTLNGSCTSLEATDRNMVGNSCRSAPLQLLIVTSNDTNVTVCDPV